MTHLLRQTSDDAAACAVRPASTTSPRFRASALALALLCFAAVFTVPYHLPVRPAFSVSYITGFNNHAAVVLFVLSAALFTYGAPSLRLRTATADQRLPKWSLLVALIVVAAVLLFVLHRHGSHWGSESQYQLERLTHLIAHQSMYRSFDYAYGPLLLYPVKWIHSLSHWDAQTSCRLVWGLQWFVGVVALWFTIAKNAVPARQRVLLFFLLLAYYLGGTWSEGLNETPFRFLSAASLSVATFVLWQRIRSPWWKALIAVAAIALAYAVSPEQGGALAFGLCAYALWLNRIDRASFPLRGLLLLAAGAAAIMLVAAHSGELDYARSSADGGYSFPLLPSPQQLFTLAIYLSAALVLGQALTGRSGNTAAVPLGLCGLPLLLPAFGRCDCGHLAGAAPLYILGLFGLARWPRVLGLYVLLLVRFSILPVTLSHVSTEAQTPTQPRVTSSSDITGISPLDHYYAPLSVPMSEDGQVLWGADSGFYLGVWDVISPANFQAKADEIERRRAPWLLLPETGQPLRFPLWQSDFTPDALHILENSKWVPHQVRPQLDGANIVATIQRLYEPTDRQQDGWRVWKLRRP